jgi:GT2 family glycosyltransferase
MQDLSISKISGGHDPHLIVIIPTHNRWASARECLAALSASDYQNFSTVLIEDGCTDKTVEECRREFPSVHILHGDGNLWWSGAINKGLEYALHQECEAIVWLNDDNTVERDTLGQLVAGYERQGSRSIICARTRTIGSGVDEWVGDPPRWHPEFGKWSPVDLSQLDVAVEHPPGGRGVLIPAQCFREIGFIDSGRFPHYWADHDFHYRAVKAGFTYYLATAATVWNAPNQERAGAQRNRIGSIRGTFWFLFNRRSPMNMVTLRRLLKRHLPQSEYRKIFFPLLKRHLAWLGYEWLSRKPLYRMIQSLKKSMSKTPSENPHH